MNRLIKLRNGVEQFFYKKLLKPIFFRMDPETVHDRMTKMGRFLGTHKITRQTTRWMFDYSDPHLEQNILGIHFKNPIGLAAGFDKNAQLADILPSLGFGFAEVGSVTGEPCAGNPKPRLWRLPKSRGLVVYYGLKNDGCEKISESLRRKKFHIPIGISIAKTNDAKTLELETEINDYAKAYQAFAEIGSYTTVNISCPNTFGGQPFNDANRLDQLLARLDTIPSQKPTFIKLSPDLTREQIDGVIEVAGRHRINGFISSNLTKKPDPSCLTDDFIPEKGGISGKVVEQASNDLIRYLYQKTKGQKILIGCGGVFCAEDAYRKIRAGASLIQLITGMVFEGPQMISEINRELVEFLKKDDFKNIAEAVGADYR